MTEILTPDEISQLSLRAIVALCSRCASRCRSEFDLPGNTPCRGQIMAAVDTAIQMARDFAAGLPLPSNAYEIDKEAMSAAGKAPASMFGTSATDAGIAAGVALTIQEGRIDLVPYRAQMCVGSVGRAAVAAKFDYNRLLQLKLGTFPEMGQPVDCTESGPLGPLWGRTQMT